MAGRVRVLVVEGNFAVAAAVDRRLKDVATVVHTDGHDVATGARDGRLFDVVVLCPYMPSRLRAQIVRRLRAASPPPLLVVLKDAAPSRRVEVRGGCSGVTPAAMKPVLDRLGITPPSSQPP